MILDRFFKRRVICNCERDAYLYRWYVIRNNRFGLFIHKFVRSDEDRALHDHPWSFLVIPIWRGYIEHGSEICPRCDGKGYQHRPNTKWNPDPITYCAPCDRSGRIKTSRRVYPILGTRFRISTYRHRVELFERDRKPLPSWSIFIRFARAREWGFWTPVGWVHWKNWWQDNCE